MNRADRTAAILDHHLGRTAERRDQLPHRIRRGAEPSAARRLHHAPAHASAGYAGRERRRLPGLHVPAQSGAPAQICAPAWRPILSPGANGLAVRRRTRRAWQWGSGHFQSLPPAWSSYCPDHRVSLRASAMSLSAMSRAWVNPRRVAVFDLGQVRPEPANHIFPRGAIQW